MAMRLLFVLATSLLVPIASAAVQTVEGARILDTARAVMASDRAGRGTDITFHPLGRTADAVVPGGKVTLHASRPTGTWPRSRVAIPVQLLVDGRSVRTETVWFAVSAKRQALVSADDAIQGTAATDLAVRLASVDVASVHGQVLQTLGPLAGMRLKQGLRAGAPLLREDFEPVPDVDVRGKVTVLVNLGAIRMQTRGTALSAGNAGQTILVLAEGAESPVRARVQSKGVVQVAR